MVKRKSSRVEMPMSSAGLIRYTGEEGRGIKFKPEHVLFTVLAVIILEVLLKMGVI